MQQPQQTDPWVEIPHSLGTLPNWDVRLGYPHLLNMFVGESESLYCTPGLVPLSRPGECPNARAILRSEFGEGSYFVVTNSSILQLFNNGQAKLIQGITNSGKAVQISENLQKQVGIVDGKNFWVYDQNSKTTTLMNESHGFSFKSPISIIVLNTFAIVLDEETNTWAISDPNNMLVFPALDNVPQISDQLTQAVSLETLSDNLYIVATTGIARWVPSSANNQYLFPFTKDTNYRQDFGAIGTNSVVRGFSEIYFLSSKFSPMKLSAQSGLQELRTKSPIGISGMARIISQYPDITKCEGSFYSFKDNYFYSMTFPDSGKNWTYCANSSTWAWNDDNFISTVESGEVVATKGGVFRLSLIPSYKRREWRSERIVKYKGLSPSRGILNGFEATIVQGHLQTKEPQNLELTLSFDSKSWSNSVVRPLGLTGERNARVVWNFNRASPEFTFLLRYQGLLDFTIDKTRAIIK